MTAAQGPEPPDVFKTGWDVFRRIVENFPIAVFTADVSGRHVFVNRHWSELTGIPRRQALEHGWELTVHPADMQRVTRCWRRLVTEGDQVAVHFRLLRSDGTACHAIVRALAVVGEGGHRRFAGTLAVMSRLPVPALDSAHRPLTERDPGSAGDEIEIVRSELDRFDAEADEIWRLLHGADDGDDGGAPTSLDRTIPSPRGPLPTELDRGRHADGAQRGSDLGPEPSPIPPGALRPGVEWRAAVASHHDDIRGSRYGRPGGDTGGDTGGHACGCAIARLDRFADACHDRERWLTDLLAELPSAVLVADRDARVVAVNQAYCELFDLAESPVDLIGTDCRAQLRPITGLVEDPAGFAGRLDQLLRRRRTQRREPVMFSDGRVFERSHLPMTGPDGYRGHIWIYVDVTDRRIVEAEIEGLISGL